MHHVRFERLVAHRDREAGAVSASAGQIVKVGRLEGARHATAEALGDRAIVAVLEIECGAGPEAGLGIGQAGDRDNSREHGVRPHDDGADGMSRRLAGDLEQGDGVAWDAAIERSEQPAGLVVAAAPSLQRGVTRQVAPARQDQKLP